MIRLLGILIMVGWGAGCADPLGWREAAGCCITDEERAVCGDVAEDYVENLREEIRRRGWDTEEDALSRSRLLSGYGYGDTSVDADCLAGLIRLENATEGFYKRSYTNGKVKYEVTYVDGKREGKWVRYYKSGKVYEEGNYEDGKLDGKWVYYDKEGNIIDEDIWKDGKCVEMCEGNELGSCNTATFDGCSQAYTG